MGKKSETFHLKLYLNKMIFFLDRYQPRCKKKVQHKPGCMATEDGQVLENKGADQLRSSAKSRLTHHAAHMSEQKGQTSPASLFALLLACLCGKL